MPLTNTQYDEIMRSYQERQSRRCHLILQRQNEISALIPEIDEIDRQAAALGVDIAKRTVCGDIVSSKDFAKQLSQLSHTKTELLKAHGYPEDYLSPPYECPDCKDTGYIGQKRCHCLIQASISLMYSQSHISTVRAEENFDRFSLSWYSRTIRDKDSDITSYDAAENALSKCRAFVQKFDSEFENILLFGDTGVGKTFLSDCIAGELLDSGHTVLYFSAQPFFDVLARNTFEHDRGAASECENIHNCDLLIIDDLGTELSTSFTASQFFICLNERIRNRKSTLISSNLGLGDIATVYSERIFSRISSDFTLLHLFGEDIRLQKKLAKL